MADAVEVERPSGSFVSIQNDGFEIRSNTGTEEDLRSDLGLDKKPAKKADEKSADTETPETPVELPTRAKARIDPKARRQSIQADIDAEVERKRVATAEADAEEARLAKIRDDAKAPPIAPRQIIPPQSQTQPQAQGKPPDYDGSDPKDPAPKIEDFANDPSGDPYTAWILARQAHVTRTEWRKQQHVSTQTAQRQHADTVYQSRMSALHEKITAHTEKDADFQKKVVPAVAQYLKWTTPDDVGVPLGDLVMDAPNTTELLVYFSENQKELARISDLHPMKQAMEFGLIQGRLQAKADTPPPKPKLVSQAKPITKPIEGMASSASAEDDKPDEELTDAQHEARYGKMRRQYR